MNETSRLVVRVQIQVGEGTVLSFIVQGNLPTHPPKHFKVNKIPELLQERISVLRMLDAGQEVIRHYGRKFALDVYYVYVTQQEWETLQPNLIKESI